MKWEQKNRWHWVAHFKGDKHGAVIHMLDERTYSVVRNGKYLGSEKSLNEAEDRARLNVRSERNMQKAFSDGIPLPPRAAAVLKAAAAEIKRREVPKEGKKAEVLKIMRVGCTREEVLRVTGWQAVSMQEMAKSLGVGLRIDKSAKPFRYFAEDRKD